MKDEVVRDACVMPRTSGSAVAGERPSAMAFWFSALNSALSTCSPTRKLVPPGSVTVTLRSIWRTMTSMCLSSMPTPWKRYTSWISSTR